MMHMKQNVTEATQKTNSHKFRQPGRSSTETGYAILWRHLLNSLNYRLECTGSRAPSDDVFGKT